jgi:hypothetical protein
MLEEEEERVRGAQLQHVMTTDPDPRVRRRAYALLLVEEGHTQAGVARLREALVSYPGLLHRLRPHRAHGRCKCYGGRWP